MEIQSAVSGRTKRGKRMTPKKQNEILRAVIHDTFWMARRYANGRHTYAPTTVNECLDTLESIGIEIEGDETLIQDGNSDMRKLDIS
jgi:hypothetical protein